MLSLFDDVFCKIIVPAFRASFTIHFIKFGLPMILLDF